MSTISMPVYSNVLLQIGKDLHGVKFYETNVEECFDIDERSMLLNTSWPHDSLTNIKWLNKKPASSSEGWELAINHASYIHDDGEVYFSQHNSHLAIIVEVIYIPSRVDFDWIKLQDNTVIKFCDLI
jgi:hypothetical protein